MTLYHDRPRAILKSVHNLAKGNGTLGSRQLFCLAVLIHAKRHGHLRQRAKRFAGEHCSPWWMPAKPTELSRRFFCLAVLTHAERHGHLRRRAKRFAGEHCSPGCLPANTTEPSQLGPHISSTSLTIWARYVGSSDRAARAAPGLRPAPSQAQRPQGAVRAVREINCTPQHITKPIVSSPRW